MRGQSLPFHGLVCLMSKVRETERRKGKGGYEERKGKEQKRTEQKKERREKSYKERERKKRI